MVKGRIWFILEDEFQREALFIHNSETPIRLTQLRLNTFMDLPSLPSGSPVLSMGSYRRVSNAECGCLGRAVTVSQPDDSGGSLRFLNDDETVRSS